MSTEPNKNPLGDFFRTNRRGIIGIGLTFGAGMGVAFGAATEHIEMWVSMGAAIGGGVGLVIGAVIYDVSSAYETE